MKLYYQICHGNFFIKKNHVLTICELYNQICHVNSKNCVNCVLSKIHVAFHKLCFCVIVIFILQDNFILNFVLWYFILCDNFVWGEQKNSISMCDNWKILLLKKKIWKGFSLKLSLETAIQKKLLMKPKVVIPNFMFQI